MLGLPVVLGVAGGYVALLFVVAFVTDRFAAAGRARWLSSPVIYTLSLSIYCTSWTFYGAVGSAVRSGIEFATIYLGPTLIFMAHWLILRRLVRIAKTQRITSIADFVSARYGKSTSVSLLVTLIAVAATTPYVALQLLAVSKSVEALVGEAAAGADAALWTAVAMAFFVIAFGTRRIAANESQPGIVAAIAFEAVVKLVALVAVAVFGVLLLQRGAAPGAALQDWQPAMERIGTLAEDGGTRWLVMLSLSAAAIVCLPRQFQVGVVENRSEAHLNTASWLFPLYLFITALCVLPIASAGLTRLGPNVAADTYVLTLPLMEGASGLAVLAFVGGLSAATSMVIVAILALAVMVSSHLVLPLLSRSSSNVVGLTPAVLTTRRMVIVVVMLLAYLYASTSVGAPLASIGLISFAGVAQFAPAMIIGLFWRGATRVGAVLGLASGGAIWLVTLFMPSFGVGVEFANTAATLLVPESMRPMDPLVFGAVLSLSVNTALFVVGSLFHRADALDSVQAAAFVDALEGATPVLPRSADRRQLYRLTRRVLGPNRAYDMFSGGPDPRDTPDVEGAFVGEVERELANAVGTASAHLLVTRAVRGEPLSIDAAMVLLDETQEAIKAAEALGVRSEELERTTRELRAANEDLNQLLDEKDNFLSRVSHEMRTPLTAMRSFAELLSDGEVPPAQARRFVDIIRTEAERLTRLLDDILDLSRLEAGVAPLHPANVDARTLAQESAAAMEGFAAKSGVTIALRDETTSVPMVMVDPDRVKQVLTNLLSNAVKFHGDRSEVVLTIASGDGRLTYAVQDYGPGVPPDVQPKLFTKFASSDDALSANSSKGAGLGLAISREIVERLGGALALSNTGPSGSTFTATLPLSGVSVGPGFGVAAQ